MARDFDLETAARPDPAPPPLAPQPEPVTNAVSGGYAPGPGLHETEPPDSHTGAKMRLPLLLAFVGVLIIAAAVITTVALTG
jgi:hypothetical protein